MRHHDDPDPGLGQLAEYLAQFVLGEQIQRGRGFIEHQRARIDPVRRFAAPVTLAAIKAEPSLAEIALIKQSRLSVMPLTKAEFDAIVRMAG